MAIAGERRRRRTWKDAATHLAVVDLILFVFVLLISPISLAEDLLDPSNDGALVHVDDELNSTNWAAWNLTDDDADSRWLSSDPINDLIFRLGPTDAPSCFTGFSLENYGSARSIESFSLLVTDDPRLAADTGTAGWSPIPADPSPSGPIDHLHWSQGARLEGGDDELNQTNWAARNLNDGSLRSRWLNDHNVNTLEYAFDTDWNGETGDPIGLREIRLHNYGGTRSISKFQIHVTRDGRTWSRVAVPGTRAGDPDFNFMMADEGGRVTRIDRELNATNWAAANLHDGSDKSIWLSDRANNELDFEFDTDFDGTSGRDGDEDDLFTIERIEIKNYGSARSVQLFQVEVQTLGSIGWEKLEVPGSAAGMPDFDFLLDWEGANLTRIADELNSSNWAARNIHDGDPRSRWLSDHSNNELDFEFDLDDDGLSGLAGDTDDLFTIERINLYNYGSSRSVKLFQIEVRTRDRLDWTPLEVPGSTAGDAGFNFALLHEGAVLRRVDRELNATNWAGRNIHDGDLRTRWLSDRQTNELVFEFDTDDDGVAGDAVNFQILRIYNYGSARSVRTFEIEVKRGGAAWEPVPAPGGGATFLAKEAAGPQDYSVGPLSGITALRLRTLTNHGDHYTGMAELELIGESVRASHTFEAGQGGGGETFLLDPEDRPVEVMAVRFRSIQNHGDHYTGLGELEILGPSRGASHTFEAAMGSEGEAFMLDLEDRPVDVMAVRFKTIRNYGDYYTGMREFRVLGPALRHAYTFEPGSDVGPHVYVLDAEDRLDGLIGIRFRTLNNHGDYYVGARQLELLGDPVGPGYVFLPNRGSAIQSFPFDPTSGRYFRLHVLDSFGDHYVGAREASLESGSGCFSATGRIVIDHDGAAVPCTPEPIDVRIVDGSGLPLIDYAGTVVLDTQTGTGDWAPLAGNLGRFEDATPGDGVATYTFVSGDRGTAGFSLVNVMDVSAIDIDVYPAKGVVRQSASRVDDDDEDEDHDDDGDSKEKKDKKDKKDRKRKKEGERKSRKGDDEDENHDDDDPPGRLGKARLVAGTPVLRDDDSEGKLVFSPSGLTLTASALPNPPPNPIDDPVPAQTAGVPFVLHLAAYGTTATDPECGMIESYEGERPIRFWVEHEDPVLAPRVPVIDSLPIASNEGASRSRPLDFEAGRASVIVRYKDVGRISIHALDDSGPIPIRGATGGFVSRPADLVVTEIESASGVPNPGSASPTGPLFARAGEPFSVRVEARDAEGDRTPSYGHEASAEGIRIRSSTLVAPARGRNGTLDDGAIGNAAAFTAGSPDGTFEGTSFSFDEVGAIRLSAGVADGSYMGTGDVVGTESGIVGRFAPSRFEVTGNSPRFRTACGIGAFTWLGQPFGFVDGGEPRLDVRAVNVAGETTSNYVGDWWRLTNESLAGWAYAVGGGVLDRSGLPGASSNPVIVSNADGTGTLTFSVGKGLAIARDVPTAPFEAELQLSVTVLDEDATAYDGNPWVFGGTATGTGIEFDVSKRFQFGRLRIENAHGSELVDLPMALRVQHFDGQTFVDDDSDSCSVIPVGALVLTPSPADLSATPTIENTPLFAGESGLVLSAPNLDGTVDIVVDLGPSGADLPWLRYDWPEDGNLDGVVDDDPRARATFGIWKGRDHLMFTREVY